MDVRKRLTIERCRELLPNGDKISDDVLLNQRDRLYGLARFLIEKFEKLTDFFTRVKTIDAKARIVK